MNWFDNLEAKEARKEKREEEMRRAEKKKADREKADAMMASALQEQEHNKGCKYYHNDGLGNETCICGMDMTFCSQKCAYASNVVGSTKVKLQTRGRKRSDY